MYIIFYWYLVNQVWFCHSINEFILLRKALKTSCYLRLEDSVKYVLKHQDVEEKGLIYSSAIRFFGAIAVPKYAAWFFCWFFFFCQMRVKKHKMVVLT